MMVAETDINTQIETTKRAPTLDYSNKDSIEPEPNDNNVETKDEICVALNNHIDSLPDEILEFILTYLPPYKDLENCCLVCKRWNGVVNNLVRRSKMNLHKGLIDFRLRWEIFSQQTAIDIEQKSGEKVCNALNGTQNIPFIAGRFSHSAVRHGNYMYVFGGGSCSDTTFNDLWRFDLSGMRWERLLSMGSYPSPKGSASMVCWSNQLILFGGWRYPSLYPPYQPWCLFDELHYYDLTSDRWTVYLPAQSPPPMAGHSASIHRDRMIVFGGYQISDGINSHSNETWCLDLHAHRWWQPRIAGNIKPPPRYGQFQLVLDDEHLLIVGGCGGPNAVYSDAWLLDMSKEIWSWRTISIRNKKFGASHMWCNPACKIDSKLVVLGPTPNMPQDFQMVKQARLPMGNGGMLGGGRVPNAGGVGGLPYNNRNNPLERPRGGGGLDQRLEAGGLGPLRGEDRERGRIGAIRGNVLIHMDNGGVSRLRRINDPILNNNPGSNASNHLFGNNNNLQPHIGNVRDLRGGQNISIDERNQNRPSTSSSSLLNHQNISRNASITTSHSPIRSGANINTSESNDTSPNGHKDLEAAHRLQRNLALRCRENEPLLPKRFDELYEDPFRMAAFNVQPRPRSISRDHNERIRRMEEKMNAIRNSRRNAMMVHEQKSVKEPSTKRIKRNVLSLFVCDLSGALNVNDPHIEWMEYKNYGIIPGAPERLILSTLVPGNGELILFGGVHKETLTEISHQVSNTIHFLSAPRDIV